MVVVNKKRKGKKVSRLVSTYGGSEFQKFFKKNEKENKLK